MSRGFELKEFLGEKQILVVEPASNYRDSFKRFLSNMKILKQIKFVTSVTEARRELLTSEVGLFIVEWKLADKNGLQFCKELKSDAIYRKIPFLLVSTENLRQDVMLAGDVGCDGYLLKPFSFEEFKSQVMSIIRTIQSPSPANVLANDGFHLLSEQKYDEAKAAFDEALIENPESARAIAGLGRIHLAKKEAVQSLPLFTKAIRLKPEFLDGYKGMLEAYTMLNDQHGILETAKILHEINPDNPSYTLLIARQLIENNDLDGSEKYFRLSIRLSPKLAEAYKGLGHVMFLKEEYDEAMKNFEKALDIDARDISVVNYLGMALVKKGKYDDGIHKYRMALKLDPFDARVLFNLGYAFEKKVVLDQALHFYEQALLYKADFEKAKRGSERIREMIAAKT